MILASLGLGSMAAGKFVKNNKELFFMVAISLMVLSFVAALQEKKNKDNVAGLIIFGVAFFITAVLLSYNKIRYGYFM